MQLILVQSEVEQAIKDYIGKLINLGPDTQIDIELAATRGAEGVKAIIELTTAAPKTVGRPRKIQTSLDKPADSGTRKQETTEPNSGVAYEPQSEPTEPSEDEPEQGQLELTEAGFEAEPVEEEATPETAPPPPPTAAPKSLFANLRKPQNQTS